MSDGFDVLKSVIDGNSNDVDIDVDVDVDVVISTFTIWEFAISSIFDNTTSNTDLRITIDIYIE